jgi:hypothetical protein
VMIAVDPIEHPAVILRHPDQLAAVPFHGTRLRSIAENPVLDPAQVGAMPIPYQIVCIIISKIPGKVKIIGGIATP